MFIFTAKIYTARRCCIAKENETLDRNEELPVNIKIKLFYYMGPSAERKSIAQQRSLQLRAEWINMLRVNGF